MHAEESREKEIKGLKDEIRTLQVRLQHCVTGVLVNCYYISIDFHCVMHYIQLAKYNVEKKVEEQASTPVDSKWSYNNIYKSNCIIYHLVTHKSLQYTPCI